MTTYEGLREKADVKWTSPRDSVEEAQNTQREGRSAMGRSTVIVTCPFCKADVEAYKWSLAGSGKRCVCGALHSWLGVSRRWKPRGHYGAILGADATRRFTIAPTLDDLSSALADGGA